MSPTVDTGETKGPWGELRPACNDNRLEKFMLFLMVIKDRDFFIMLSIFFNKLLSFFMRGTFLCFHVNFKKLLRIHKLRDSFKASARDL